MTDPMTPHKLMTPHDLTTARLRLREWRASDLELFAALNADPAVMEFMSRCLSREESDAFAAVAQAEIAHRGWGLWATELRDSGQLIGCVGLSVPSFHTDFAPCVELHWRLERASWGRGFATEGARACLEFAFASLELPEVVAFTVPANTRSRAVMERLGMWHDVEGDFEHPRLPPGDPLRRHVLYRLTREHWQRGAAVGLTRH
jgi:RimJ/RimL family protein N-acetyltransferase